MPSPSGAAGSYTVISADCADRLLADLNIDWSSFGEGPHDVVVPETTGDRVVSGAFALVAADMGTVGAVFAEPTLPELLRTGLEEVRGDLSDDAPAGALWYAFATTRIDGIRANLPIDYFGDGRWMSYDLSYDVGTVLVESLMTGSTAGDDIGVHPIEVASALVHEAAHRTAPVHTKCPLGGDACDLTPEGAIGWVSAGRMNGSRTMAMW